MSTAAMLLDFDGVIIDSEGANAQAWAEEFKRAHHVLEPREYSLCREEWRRRRLIRVEDHLTACDPHPDMTGVDERHKARYTELRSELPARPGIEAWMREAREYKMTVAVVTTSPEHLVASHLARLGLSGDAQC